MAAAVRRFVAAVAFVFSYQEHNICGAEASRVRRRSIVSNGHRQHHRTKSVCVCDGKTRVVSCTSLSCIDVNERLFAVLPACLRASVRNMEDGGWNTHGRTASTD